VIAEAELQTLETATQNIELTDKQCDAWWALHDPNVLEVLFGGAKGGAKTVLACIFAMTYAIELADTYGIKPSQYPVPVGFMGRKYGKHFRDTTLETWKEVIPAGGYTIRDQAGEIVIQDRVKVDFGGFDSQETVNKFNSAEYVFFVVDQAEELTRDDVAVLRASLRRKIKGQVPHYVGLFTANPADCFLKDDFLVKPDPRRRFVKALPTDNPHLPDGYIDRLKDSFRHRPELLAAYLHGSWDALAGADIIIKDYWVANANLLYRIGSKTYKAIACDPARFGDDETVIYYLENGDIKDVEIFGQRDTMYTAGMLNIMAEKHKSFPTEKIVIAIDTTGGLGAGPADRLVEMGCNVMSVNSSERAIDAKFLNRRAGMWWHAGELFGSGEHELHYDDPELKRQLSAVKYTFKQGRIAVEGKDDIKKRLGRSPDRADAYVIGLHALQSVTATEDQRKANKPGFLSTFLYQETSSPWGV